MIMPFIFYFSNALTFWGLADPGETVPSSASQFLETVKDSPLNMAFICKLINTEPIPPWPPLLGSYTPGHYPPALMTPGPSTRQLNDSLYTLYPMEPTEIIQTSKS